MKHALNVIRVHSVLPGRVLDVGCAPGTLGYLLSERDFDVPLVDVRPTHIEYARERSGTARPIRYCIGLVPEVPSEDEFDVVICTEVVEHMPTSQTLLTGLKAKCRVGGILYLTTPNGSYFLIRFADLLHRP